MSEVGRDDLRGLWQGACMKMVDVIALPSANEDAPGRMMIYIQGVTGSQGNTHYTLH